MEQPSYFSILTADVRYDPQLVKNPELQVMFSEITALSNKWGYCTATNAYFANLYDRTPKTISNRITKLVERGFLKRELIKDGNQIKERRLYPVINRGINVDVNRGHNVDVNRGINVDVKENNININRDDDEENKKAKIKIYDQLIELSTFNDGKTIKPENTLKVKALKKMVDECSLDLLRRVRDSFETQLCTKEIREPFSYLLTIMGNALDSDKNWMR